VVEMFKDHEPYVLEWLLFFVVNAIIAFAVRVVLRAVVDSL
jgi:hypothetical protein